MRVFSMPVVSNAGFYYYSGRTQTMKMIKNEETEDSEAFSEIKHKHSTPAAVLTTHAITGLL